MTLTLGGRYAGEQLWTLHTERSSLVARVQTDFGGVLPEVRRVQTSRMHPRALTSQGYAEGDGRGRASFETVFDRRSGLITLRQGKEEVSQPLTTDYHDPVSLLLWLRLRCASGADDRLHAQLTGGRVLIQRLPDTEIGGVQTCGYFLRPGNAYVYIGRGGHYPLMRLIQPTDFGPIEANVQGEAHKPATPERERRRRRAGGSGERS
ncbi:hypothetical protein DEDE109153_10265 [Deinococcus deserti]|uniref:Uncharacterized protein n=1 Tax=Deinococcus deserti (strain DSM 17065 / CIP 109153 / LMG 22923 / VCD115) TaxID=546414 RepID=C1CZU5_DEIDV|nr:hypothetical protein [Deinococcus deserti]ACO45197.1 hypothetical protein Deide_03750 [Deinococcus deserti VCD115]